MKKKHVTKLNFKKNVISNFQNKLTGGNEGPNTGPDLLTSFCWRTGPSASCLITFCLNCDPNGPTNIDC